LDSDLDLDPEPGSSRLGFFKNLDIVFDIDIALSLVIFPASLPFDVGNMMFAIII
jgi:hypothetical protein